MGKGPDVTYFIELFAPQDVAKKPKSAKKNSFCRSCWKRSRWRPVSLKASCLEANSNISYYGLCYIIRY